MMVQILQPLVSVPSAVKSLFLFYLVTLLLRESNLGHEMKLHGSHRLGKRSPVVPETMKEQKVIESTRPRDTSKSKGHPI
jgi:hypothetical protein